MTHTVGYLQHRRRALPNWTADAPEGVDVMAVPETELADLPTGAISALLVGMHVDQCLFAANRAWTRGFLAAGGTVIMNGLLAYPFLDGLARFQPLPRRSREALEVRIVEPVHPILRGVSAHDLSYRKGVAGFYGRGQVPPLPGARVISTLDHGTVPLDWEWPAPGGGRLLMHPGNDLWMYAGGPTSAARMAHQMLAWAARLPGFGEDAA